MDTTHTDAQPDRDRAEQGRREADEWAGLFDCESMHGNGGTHQGGGRS